MRRIGASGGGGGRGLICGGIGMMDVCARNAPRRHPPRGERPPSPGGPPSLPRRKALPTPGRPGPSPASVAPPSPEAPTPSPGARAPSPAGAAVAAAVPTSLCPDCGWQITIPASVAISGAPASRWIHRAMHIPPSVKARINLSDMQAASRAAFVCHDVCGIGSSGSVDRSLSCPFAAGSLQIAMCCEACEIKTEIEGV